MAFLVRCEECGWEGDENQAEGWYYTGRGMELTKRCPQCGAFAVEYVEEEEVPHGAE
jgi:predicted  nucleic acid-binding Zn-ribbon protein